MTSPALFSAKASSLLRMFAAAALCLAGLVTGCRSAEERDMDDAVDLRSQAMEWPDRDGQNERGPREPMDQY